MEDNQQQAHESVSFEEKQEELAKQKEEQEKFNEAYAEIKQWRDKRNKEILHYSNRDLRMMVLEYELSLHAVRQEMKELSKTLNKLSSDKNVAVENKEEKNENK